MDIGKIMKKILFIITIILTSSYFYNNSNTAFLFAKRASAQVSNNNRPNVVFIIINAARADHLGTYGYKRDTAPNIDRLAKKAVIFEQAIAQAHWTLPSLASILTSRYPHTLGIYERGQKIPEEELTLAEILKRYGYKTAAFVGGLDTDAAFGFAQGFDYYFDETKDSPIGSFKDIIPNAIEWLKDNKNNKFFLLIHGYDVHPPFNQPAPYKDMYDPDYKGIIDELPLDYSLLKNIRKDSVFINGKTVKLSKEDINHIIANYDAGISYADKLIGEFLNTIDNLDLSSNTIIIITSEHGEELLDHGSFDRFGKSNLYDEVIRVPLIIKNPNIDFKGERITNQVQLIDIMPTILDFLGIPIDRESQGLSLAPLIQKRGVKDDFNQYVYSEAGLQKWAIRTSQWKLIYDNGSYQLYNLKEDNLEVNNLAVKRPEVVYEFAQRLSQWRQETGTEIGLYETRIELSEEMREKFKKAGYW